MQSRIENHVQIRKALGLLDSARLAIEAIENHYLPSTQTELLRIKLDLIVEAQIDLEDLAASIPLDSAMRDEVTKLLLRVY